MGLGTGILLSLGFAFTAAITAMLISGTASEMTLATTKFDDKDHSHH